MGVFTIKRKDGSKAWYYSFMYNGVRYRKLGGSTKTQALLAMEKVRNSVFNEDYGLVEKVKNPRIEDFAKTFLERRKHIRSFKRDELSVRILLRYFRGKTMSSISSVSSDLSGRFTPDSGPWNGRVLRGRYRPRLCKNSVD